MGLDMYLTAKRYVSGYEHSDSESKALYAQVAESMNVPVDRLQYGSPSVEVAFSVGYWRKDNAVHNWFVQNVQDGTDDCEEYEVSWDDLSTLRSVCKAIKDSAVLGETEIVQDDIFGSWEETKLVYIDKGLIEATLPPSPGFFFGSTDVDGYYYDMLVRTIEIIDNIVPDPAAITDGKTEDVNPFQGMDLYYRSSW